MARYHEWITSQLMEERMNNPFVDCPDQFGYTTCDHCGQMMLRLAAHVVTKHTGATARQFHFCGIKCEQDYLVNMLRKEGL